MRSIKCLFVIFFTIISISTFAQTKADKLFSEGINLQKTMTMSSQEAAIKKFSAAKIIYNVSDKKQNCVKQIAVCKKNINKLKADKKPQKQKKNKENQVQKNKEISNDIYENEVIVIEKPVIVEKRVVTLGARPGSLLFKWNPKGKTQTIEVNCNYNDWVIVEQPQWVHTSITYDRRGIIVEADVNQSKMPRYGTIKVRCGDLIATIIVEQKKGKRLK